MCVRVFDLIWVYFLALRDAIRGECRTEAIDFALFRKVTARGTVSVSESDKSKFLPPLFFLLLLGSFSGDADMDRRLEMIGGWWGE